MPQSQRNRRIADLIQRHLALHLKKDINDPRLAQVVFTSVDLAPDLKQAKVYFSLIDDKQAIEVTAALEKASGFLRTLIAHSCTLRYTPRLIFIYDDSIIKGEYMDQLLKSLPDSSTPDSQDSNDE